ncbi:MAG TPA: outer membrane lipoprotein-sorting protein [Deferrimonas sp.]
MHRFRRRTLRRLAAAVLLAGCLFSPGVVQALELRELIRHVEQQYHGTSSHARTAMQVRTEHWQRSLEMEAWSLERDRFLVRILAPAKERGVATLKVDREVWNFLPRVDRVIKVPPSMMGGAWMGSHITNDDLVKASHVDEDYTFTLLEESPEHYLIECLPKVNAAVVWGKIVYEILKPQLVPGTVTYYDEGMIAVREILFADVRTTSGRTLPMRMTVRPLDKPGEETVLQYQEITFDVPLTAAFFSLRTLKER